MSPEERKVYMREYMRARRAAIKNGELTLNDNSKQAHDYTGENEGDDIGVSPVPSWLVWGILGGLGLLFIGMVVATIVTDIRETRAGILETSEDTQNVTPNELV